MCLEPFPLVVVVIWFQSISSASWMHLHLISDSYPVSPRCMTKWKWGVWFFLSLTRERKCHHESIDWVYFCADRKDNLKPLFCCSMCVSEFLHWPVLRDGLVWITIWSALHLLIVLRCPYRDCLLWECCYGVLCEWWSFYRRPAANSFHLPNSGWLRLRLVFFFPHGLVSQSVIFERRVCFWFNFQITFMWEHYWPSHVFLKALQRKKTCELIVREVI